MRSLDLQRTFTCRPGNSSVTAEQNFTKRDIWGVYSKFMSSCQIQLKLEGLRGSGADILYAHLHVHGDKYLSE